MIQKRSSLPFFDVTILFPELIAITELSVTASSSDFGFQTSFMSNVSLQNCCMENTDLGNAYLGNIWLSNTSDNEQEWLADAGEIKMGGVQ